MARGYNYDSLELQGLELAPSQVLGSIRLVPVLRKKSKGKLYMGLQQGDDIPTAVALKGNKTDPDMIYGSYIPHGLIITSSKEKHEAMFGTRLLSDKDMKNEYKIKGVRLLHRMAKRVDKNTLRLLPLHIAMEGYLSCHFGGPDIAWKEYCNEAFSRGLSPRYEYTIRGRDIVDLQDALRIFEIHEDQVGVLLFVSESFISASIVSRPQDYRKIHDSLIQDFYGEYLYYYGIYGETAEPLISDKVSSAASMEDLFSVVKDMKEEWNSFHKLISINFMDRKLYPSLVNKIKQYTLQRFRTDLNPNEENHFGEVICDNEGNVEYLKTYRLSAAQTKRAYLLYLLSAHQWNIDETAKSQNQTKSAFVLRMVNAGFRYILKDHIIREAQRNRL